MTSIVRQTWWRRERLSLVLLPLALVAAIAASSSRVHDFWWAQGFRSEAPVSAAGIATVDLTYDDGFLTYPIRAEVSLGSATPVTELPGADAPVRVPTGSRLWLVDLAWTADPDVVLTGCSVALVDRDGRRYDASVNDFDANAPIAYNACVPDETPGPVPQPGSTETPTVEQGQQSRPESYATTAYVIAPEDVRPVAARVWWLLPDYVELPVKD